MKEYYGKRAEEYEAIYNRDDPVRKRELEEMKSELAGYFMNMNVLEVACGTGYWTEIISKTAARTLAFDFSNEVLDIARSKKLNAEFVTDNAYMMNNVKEIFDGGCANFWFSHIPKNKISEFLNVFHNKLKPGAKVYMADNVYIEGVGGELIKKSNDENTYKKRLLSEGSSHIILKNYYTAGELEKIFTNISTDIKIEYGKCFWRIMYQTV